MLGLVERGDAVLDLLDQLGLRLGLRRREPRPPRRSRCRRCRRADRAAASSRSSTSASCGPKHLQGHRPGAIAGQDRGSCPIRATTAAATVAGGSQKLPPVEDVLAHPCLPVSGSGRAAAGPRSCTRRGPEMKKKRAIRPPSRWNSLIGCGVDAGLGQARMQAVEVVDAERDVAIAVAVRVRLGAALVERQLDLEIGLGVAQIDQGEAVEVEPVGDVEARVRCGRTRSTGRGRAPGPSCEWPWPCARSLLAGEEPIRRPDQPGSTRLLPRESTALTASDSSPAACRWRRRRRLLGGRAGPSPPAGRAAGKPPPPRSTSGSRRGRPAWRSPAGASSC